MKHVTFFFIAFIFCLNVGCLSSPIEGKKTSLWIYKYEGRIETTNSALHDKASTWSVIGNLSIYNSEKYVILKLDDVKTSLFNGKKSDLLNIEAKEIPPESKAILEPFYLKKDGEHLFIYFNSDEPMWSKNFKRGIVSNLDVDTVEDLKNKKNKTFKEKSVHGYCEVSYDIEESDKKIAYKKIINHEKCSQLPEFKITNSKKNVSHRQQQQSKTVKTAIYLLNDKGDPVPSVIKSSSSIEVHFTYSARNTQHVDQIQNFYLNQELEVDHEPDISNVTEKHDLIYEISNDSDPTLGRHIYETDTSKLIKQFLDNYEKFDKKYAGTGAKHLDVSTDNEIEEMIKALFYMKAEGFEMLIKEFEKKDDIYKIFGLYYSMLPYLGTDEFIKYLTNNINKEILRSNEISLGRVLAILPYFLHNPTEKTLEDLEILINLQPTLQRSAKNAGVLCFANTVTQINKKITLPQEKVDKYIKLYHDKYISGEDYEERMSFLLGLVNMADILNIELINGIITNKTESHYLRNLAITGFKSRLSSEDAKINDLYNIYWDMVQNKEEPFEVRVSALDLLLSFKLNDEQLNTIIKKYSVHSDDPPENHLANYLLTTLHSVQNITAYNDNLGPQASVALQNNQIPFFPKTFVTGNYRVSHTDKDFGAFLETQIISNPSTNAIDIAKITYNSYGLAYNLGTYTLYIKTNGLIDSLYADYFFKTLKYTTSVPEIIKMLKENSFIPEKLDRKIDIDIVIFCDDVAVYAAHYGRYDSREFKQFVGDLGQYHETFLYVEYPLVDYKHIPSDLGTPLQFSHLIENVGFHNEESLFEYKHTSHYQIWLESYNPLLDTNIASYKYLGYELYAKLNVTIDKEKRTISWIHKNDSIAAFWDNLVGTSVEDEKLLKEFCKDCTAYSNVEFDCSEEGTKDYQALGIKLHTSIDSQGQSCPLEYNFQQFLMTQSFDINDDATVLADPILLFSHYASWRTINVHELSRGSHKIEPYFNEETESSITVNFGGDIKKLFKPLVEKYVQFKIDLRHKSLGNENLLNLLSLNYELDLNSSKKNIILIQKIDIDFVPHNSSLEKQISQYSEVVIPGVQSDIYSLEHVEPATGKMTINFIKKYSEDKQENSTWNEIYSSSNKAEKLENKQNKEDYEECQKNSKDLKYTDPSSACRRISRNLAEYDKYHVSITSENIKTGIPSIEYYRKDDYIKFALVKKFENSPQKVYYNKTIYYPYNLINPISLYYGEHTSGLPFLSQSTCTISPTKIEQFSGKFIPNQKEKFFAFAECINYSTKGLSGRIIDKHIEFDFYSKNDVLKVQYRDGKAQLKLNGKELHDTYAPEDSDLSVIFLDQNVFYIMDDQYVIYYNTEYVQIRINSLLTKLLCGLCTKDL